MLRAPKRKPFVQSNSFQSISISILMHFTLTSFHCTYSHFDDKDKVKSTEYNERRVVCDRCLSCSEEEVSQRCRHENRDVLREEQQNDKRAKEEEEVSSLQNCVDGQTVSQLNRKLTATIQQQFTYSSPCRLGLSSMKKTW